MANEKRLILLDHALQAVSENYRSDMPKFELDMLVATRKRLKSIPTVDAVEVVHGRWLDVQETDMYVPDMKFTITKTAGTCSKCKARIGFVGAKRYLFDSVCPNCGAKMDGERKDND